jgi:hypothetical protein
MYTGTLPYLFSGQLYWNVLFSCKLKSCSLHATKAFEWRGGIAPTHSRLQH